VRDDHADNLDDDQTVRPGFFQLVRESGLRRPLLGALPALVAAGGVLVTAGAAVMIDANQLHARYFDEAVRHFHARDYKAARVGFERLVRENSDRGSREVRYNLAVCLDALGEPEPASALIDQLAPDDRRGFAPAHVWKARRLWAGSNHTPAEVRAGEEHLLRALQDAPNASEPSAMLGQFYLAAGRAEKAVEYLRGAVAERPEMLLPLARAELALDRGTVARTRAREARLLFKSRAEADLDDHESRLLWVEADLILDDFAEAVDALQREAVVKTDARYPRALAQVYLAWADSLARYDRSKLAERLALLERGLTHDPASMPLLGRFSEVIRAGGDEGDRARSALQALVARGVATGPVRYALGLDAWEHGRAAEARLHWEEACRLSPQMPAFVNNLACVLADGENPDLPRALDTINPVIARWPAETRFRATRGRILAKLKRWNEALPDLEAGLTAYPDGPELHQALAETYKHLDAPGMAAEHRHRAGTGQSSATPVPPAGTKPSESSGKE
jgi:tetratricopeptide (TPR) repeat protein